ncbi:MAG: K+ channel, inward rectifier [Cytophagia bacterium]|nr:K+ channel, inward rectifier [Cytophagia bacterium]
MAQTRIRHRRSKELGFGEKAYGKYTRLIKPDGNFNVKKSGLGFWQSLDIYHELISMKWLGFIGLITLIFFLINLLFAWLYYMAGFEGISGQVFNSPADHFLSSFYFSTQTITTVGFGKLSPESNYVSTLAAIESFIGLLGFALATGLMFARFSRPKKNIVYSETAIISPYKQNNALMFRLANSSKTRMIESEVNVVISYWDAKSDRRIFEPVDLERDKINFLSTTWTIVHPITENSPIYGWTAKNFEECQVEVIVMFKAFDDTYVRQIYDRISYLDEEIQWGRKFVPVYDKMDDGMMHVKLERLGETIEAALN